MTVQPQCFRCYRTPDQGRMYLVSYTSDLTLISGFGKSFNACYRHVDHALKKELAKGFTPLQVRSIP